MEQNQDYSKKWPTATATAPEKKEKLCFLDGTVLTGGRAPCDHNGPCKTCPRKREAF